MGLDPITIAAGGAALGALSKPKSPKVAGGGIDPFLKPYLGPGLDKLKAQFEGGPRVFQGQRVADFDPEQLAAQSSLLALATGQPDYYDTAARSIEEAIALSRQGAAPITAEEIAAQRELLEPTAEAQRLAQQQAFEGAIRDVGLGAGGAGVGALEGARADILRGGAAGELALGMANIESGLQERAIAQAGAERDRQAQLSSQLAALAQQGLQVGQEGFAEQAERVGFQAGVGAERRGLEQQRIGAEMAKFAEADPFKFTQQYLQTAFGTPTLPTQIYQPQSTAQSILGGMAAVSGFMNQGGAINSLASGGSTYGKPYTPMSIEDFQKDLEDQKVKEEVQEKFKKDSDRLKKEDKAKAKKTAKDKFRKGLKGLAEGLADADDALNPDTLIGSQQGRSTQVSMQQDARARARRRLGMFENGGVVNKDDNKQERGFLGRMVDSVRSGYQALRDIDYDPETKSLGKYDPFAGFDRSERLRIGLAMIGQMPQLGQGPLQAAAAGAGTALSEIGEEKAAEELAQAKIDAANIVDPKLASASLLKTHVDDVVANSMGAVVTKQFNPATNQEETIITIDGKAISGDKQIIIGKKIAEGKAIYNKAYSDYMERRTTTRPTETEEYKAWVKGINQSKPS